MKKILATIGLGIALALAIPGSSSAHGGHDHGDEPATTTVNEKEHTDDTPAAPKTTVRPSRTVAFSVFGLGIGQTEILLWSIVISILAVMTVRVRYRNTRQNAYHKVRHHAAEAVTRGDS